MSFFREAESTFSHYDFVFGDDFESCQIYPHLKLPFGLTFRVPTAAVSFTMTRQHPAAGACPPRANSSTAEVVRCAKWRRDSRVLPQSQIEQRLNRRAAFHMAEQLKRALEF